MKGRGQPNVYTIAPGSSFIPTLVTAFLDDTMGIGVSRSSDPLRFADATIYVPTRRAAMALSTAFSAAMAGPTLLPKIVPLGALGDLEDRLAIAAEAEHTESILPAIADLERRLHLTRLLAAWNSRYKTALLAASQAEGEVPESLAVAASLADAFALSGDLVTLMDDLILEGVGWESVKALAPEHDRYWALTTEFLDIIATAWPEFLASDGLIDLSERQNQLLRAETKRLSDAPPDAPVIVAGSTGSIPATADLMACIARLPQGAIVLPGLDQALEAIGWEKVGAAAGAEAASARAGHPQAALKRLIGRLGIERDAVRELGAASPILQSRSRLLSEALRPAETTDQWVVNRASQTPEAMEDATNAAFAGVALIEAADEHEEALSIALKLREALETPGKTATLITPDRQLAQRVSAELLRWNIEVEDSAGLDLAASPAGTFARLAIEAAAKEFAAEPFVALMMHPLMRLGMARERVLHLAGVIEIGALRGVTVRRGLSGLREAVETILERAGHRHAASAVARISREDCDRALALLSAFEAAIGPFAQHLAAPEAPLNEAAGALSAALVALSTGEDGNSPLGASRDGTGLLERLDAILLSQAATMPVSSADLPALLPALLKGIAIVPAQAGHPRLHIFGLLEARLLPADLLVLGGLNEGTWPPAARTDAFLNRPMRLSVGLEPPEGRIGQTAHDFAQAMGHESVVITRAARVEGTPAVASRFLQRLSAFLGSNAWEKVRARGDETLAIARQLDVPEIQAAAITRPRPMPALERRPARLSLTEIETFYRDPYAIYARHVLALKPLDDLSPPLGASERGMLVHEALADFLRAPPAGNRLEQLLECGRARFAPHWAEPEVAVFWWPRFERMARWFVENDALRRARVAFSAVETDGRHGYVLDDGSGFTLSGRADRIDVMDDGTLAIIDYKTGGAPGKAEVIRGLAPQLTLAAAIARHGGFKAVPGGKDAGALIYLLVAGNDGGGKKVAIEPKDITLPELVRQHEAQLLKALSSYRDTREGYVSRKIPKRQNDRGPYDHLARLKEWSETAGVADEDSAETPEEAV